MTNILASNLNVMNKFLADNDRQLVILSDFDETMVNRYIFDGIRNRHIPIIKKRLQFTIQKAWNKGHIPIFVCTARGGNDPIIKSICKLTHQPIVIENGGAIFTGRKVKLLLSNKETSMLQSLKTKITDTRHQLKKMFLEKGLELVIQLERSTDVEFRIQHFNGSGLNDKQAKKFYGLLNKTLSRNLCEFSHQFESVFTGSSLSIKSLKISKSSGIQHLIKLKCLNRKKLSVIALGDNENDREMMDFADFSISVGSKILGNEDIHLNKGEKSTITILRNIIKTRNLIS